MDMGCGCGVISFGILLLHRKKQLRVTGVEICRELAEMAKDNALNLGLQEAFEVIEGDIKCLTRDSSLAQSFDSVVCNPPYRKRESGRTSPSSLKNLAHFEGETTLADFIKAGTYFLKTRGRFYLSWGSERLVELMVELRRHRLEPKRLMCVHGHLDNPCRIVLIECVKNGAPALIIEPPLILYEGSKGENIPHERAVKFCPFIKK